MRKAGQLAIVQFPTVALGEGKPRPVLLIAPLPGPYEDWLVSIPEGFDTKDLQEAKALIKELNH